MGWLACRFQAWVIMLGYFGFTERRLGVKLGQHSSLSNLPINPKVTLGNSSSPWEEKLTANELSEIALNIYSHISKSHTYRLVSTKKTLRCALIFYRHRLRSIEWKIVTLCVFIKSLLSTPGALVLMSSFFCRLKNIRYWEVEKKSCQPGGSE